MAVFNGLQSSDGDVPKYPGANMFEWTLREPTECHKMAARLIPTELADGVAGNGGVGPLLSNVNDKAEKSNNA